MFMKRLLSEPLMHAECTDYADFVRQKKLTQCMEQMMIWHYANSPLQLYFAESSISRQMRYVIVHIFSTVINPQGFRI